MFGKYKIALIKIGGYGDSISLLFLANSVKRKYPDSQITLFVRDNLSILSKSPSIFNIVVCGYKSQIDLVKKYQKQYDIFYDNRYVCKVIYNTKDFPKDNFECQTKFKGLERDYEKYFDILNEYNQNLLDLSFYTSDLEKKSEDLDLVPLIVNDRFSSLFEGIPYVVVHCCGDEVRSTKSWSIKYWDILVSWLVGRGLKVFQVGTKSDKLISGVVDLREKMTLEDTLSLIKGAKFIVDTEGLLPHLAVGVNTLAVVIFGPTPISCFGYSQNINIESDLKCKNCWYKTSDWYKQCPLYKVSYCKAMSAITPRQVQLEICKIP